MPENFQKSLSTILYLFIAAIAPAITFGSRFLDGTNGQFGVLEMMVELLRPLLVRSLMLMRMLVMTLTVLRMCRITLSSNFLAFVVEPSRLVYLAPLGSLCPFGSLGSCVVVSFPVDPSPFLVWLMPEFAHVAAHRLGPLTRQCGELVLSCQH